MLLKTFCLHLAVLGGVLGMPVVDSDEVNAPGLADASDLAFMKSLLDFMAQREQIALSQSENKINDEPEEFVGLEVPYMAMSREENDFQSVLAALLKANKDQAKAKDAEDSENEQDLEAEEEESSDEDLVPISYDVDSMSENEGSEDEVAAPGEAGETELDTPEATDSIIRDSSTPGVDIADDREASGDDSEESEDETLPEPTIDDETKPNKEEAQQEQSQHTPNDTVHSTDFRIETGLFFGVDKHGDTDDDCSDDDDDEKRSLLKKVLFFLPSSLQPGKPELPKAENTSMPPVPSNHTAHPNPSQLTGSHANFTSARKHNSSSLTRKPLPRMDDIYHMMDSSGARSWVKAYWLFAAAFVVLI